MVRASVIGSVVRVSVIGAVVRVSVIGAVVRVSVIGVVVGTSLDGIGGVVGPSVVVDGTSVDVISSDVVPDDGGSDVPDCCIRQPACTRGSTVVLGGHSGRPGGTVVTAEKNGYGC